MLIQKEKDKELMCSQVKNRLLYWHLEPWQRTMVIVLCQMNCLVETNCCPWFNLIFGQCSQITYLTALDFGDEQQMNMSTV